MEIFCQSHMIHLWPEPNMLKIVGHNVNSGIVVHSQAQHSTRISYNGTHLISTIMVEPNLRRCFAVSSGSFSQPS